MFAPSPGTPLGWNLTLLIRKSSLSNIAIMGEEEDPGSFIDPLQAVNVG
jgi:hypothetical protein